MRQHEETCAKIRQHFACMAVVFQDRVDIRIGLAPTIEPIGTTAVIDPDVSVGTNVNASCRTPCAPIGKFCPLCNDLGCRIRQLPIDKSRVGGRVLFYCHCFFSRGRRCTAAACDHCRQRQRQEHHANTLQIITHSALSSSRRSRQSYPYPAHHVKQK